MAEQEQKFEVGVFNQEVVDQMAKGLRHKHLKDDWAENQYFQVTAESVEAARRKMERRFPPENGYVISSIEIIKDDKY
jgi:ribosomal protein L16/L10AE